MSIVVIVLAQWSLCWHSGHCVGTVVIVLAQWSLCWHSGHCVGTVVIVWSHLFSFIYSTLALTVLPEEGVHGSSNHLAFTRLITTVCVFDHKKFFVCHSRFDTIQTHKLYLCSVLACISLYKYSYT